MSSAIDFSDTICAPATASGGALNIIRISGGKAIDITSQIFYPASGRSFTERKANMATFGEIRDGEQVIDEVVALPYRAPHSYTGEDSVEITCHGSRFITDRIISLLLSHGCRMARPGEYTERAFLKGKMDLSQAEAVADVIAARSEAFSSIAIHQLRGSLSKAIDQIRERLIHLISMLELSLDFSDHEDLEFASQDKVLAATDAVIDEIKRLTASFAEGNMVKNGIPVAIIGRPNVGKSTLMNTLLGDNRAIVSARPGTTRDTIEETLYIAGTEFRMIDTAGLRTTDDDIEQAGIDRAMEQIEKAQIILCVVSADSAADDLDVLRSIGSGAKVIIAVNKCDLHPKGLDSIGRDVKSRAAAILGTTPDVCCISARRGTGIPALRKLLTGILPHHGELSGNTTIIVNRRHYDTLRKALSQIEEMRGKLLQGEPAEILSLYLRDAADTLTALGGGTTPDEVLNTLFIHISVGK